MVAWRRDQPCEQPPCCAEECRAPAWAPVRSSYTGGLLLSRYPSGARKPVLLVSCVARDNGAIMAAAEHRLGRIDRLAAIFLGKSGVDHAYPPSRRASGRKQDHQIHL